MQRRSRCQGRGRHQHFVLAGTGAAAIVVRLRRNVRAWKTLIFAPSTIPLSLRRRPVLAVEDASIRISSASSTLSGVKEDHRKSPTTIRRLVLPFGPSQTLRSKPSLPPTLHCPFHLLLFLLRQLRFPNVRHPRAPKVSKSRPEGRRSARILPPMPDRANSPRRSTTDSLSPPSSGSRKHI